MHYRILRAARHLLVLAVTFTVLSQQSTAQEKRILVFSKTKGFRHASIPAGQQALFKLGKENGYAVDTTERSEVFKEENLQRYGAVVFLNTTGDVLNDEQQSAFERYIQGGGGYVGIHAATDTEYDWPWYNKLSGAYFLSHPSRPNVQEGEAYAVDKNHPSMFGFPDRWKIKDEFYDFKNFNKNVNVLVNIDEKTYKEGKMGDQHPMSWYHEFDGGKAFYTNFGHEDATYENEVFLKHVLGGLRYVWADKIDYSKSRPEENRFSKNILVEGLDEPTELAVLEDHRVLFAERKGALKLYDPKTQKVKVVGEVPVYTQFEYGLMGLNIDPNFSKNQWIYLFYSPPSGSADTAQHLSRFVYDSKRDTLLLDTEKVLLTVPVKRNECCHTGGSIEWDAKGNLYLSTGDDVNPFNINGYSPADSRPGREGWNALHTSSNTNDLRGKILRIKPEENGTYSIPEGNLFPPGNPKARPEIYVMGNRNPYRISVDKRTGFLYWGEVGPDAANDNPDRGPRGHDEVNQARKAGYFGWPLFVADNRAYNRYDFETKVSGEKYDPLRPVNESAHNTGLRELPPAQPAFIYYPYADSPEFGPVVGKGGRNAMAGPVYYFDDYESGKDKFPRYYDGKFFAYDWIRDYINIVSMNKEGDLTHIERFMPNEKFSHPIDMQFTRDGALYVLEYGNKWFAQNDDARLSLITFNAGNRRPKAVASADKTVGSLPLTVKFSSKGSVDYDGDPIRYSWNFGRGQGKSNEANPTYVYKKSGEYTAELTVTDAKGNSRTSHLVIKVGNEPPKVEVAVQGNRTFYWKNNPLNYEVKVTDKEDGTLAGKKIAEEDVYLNIDYLEGFDKTVLAQGHQANTGFATGKRLIELSDCQACHTINEKSIGPTYSEIAKKYEKDNNAQKTLAKKIIEGGGGVWGQQSMAPHPQHKMAEAEDMVKYILSFAKEKKNSSPLKGSYLPEAKEKPGSYIFSASYTDKGSPSIGPLTGVQTLSLRPSLLPANTYDDGVNVLKYTLPENTPNAGREVVIASSDKAYIRFDDIDLSQIKTIAVSAASSKGRTAGGKIEVRLDSPTGPKIGEGLVEEDSNKTVNVPLKPSTSGKNRSLFFVFVNPQAANKPLFSVSDLSFEL
jgi:cytochrome c